MTVVAMGTDTGRAESALSAVAAGESVVLIDRDGHGVLAFAAAHATTSLLAFTVRHTSGFVRVAVRAETCDRLHLPPMHSSDEIHRVTVDLNGHGTGISAVDRAATIGALADPSSEPDLFTRPGHVVPVLVRQGGVLLDDSTVQAASDLAALAGSTPAGAFCELVSTEDPMGIPGPDEAARFASEHDLAMLSIGDLVTYRRRCAPGLRRDRRSSVHTPYGRFDTVHFTTPSGDLHTALLAGLPEGGVDVPVHLRRPCVARDAFGPQACPCGRQTDTAMLTIAARGCGVVLNLRQASPSSACTEQDADSFESDLDAAIGVLSELNIRSFQLIPEHRGGRPRAGTATVSGAVSR